MNGYKIQFRSDALDAALSRLKGATTDMLPAWQDVGEYLVESTKARFRDGVGPDGTPWAEKSPTTIAAYLARGDGNLTRPLIGPSRRLSSEIHYTANSDGVVAGSSLIYALVQQLGASKGQFGATAKGAPIPWGRIPARPFLGINREDELNIIDIIDEHFAAAVE